MKIVFLAPFGIRPKGTLIARMLPLAGHLQELGHEVVIVAPPYTNPEDSGKVETVGNVTIRNITLGPLKGAAAAPLLAWRMFCASRDETPDLVHLFKPKGYGGLAAMFHLFLSGIGFQLPPLYVDCDDREGHGGMNDLCRYSLPERLLFQHQERNIPRRADGVTVASLALANMVGETGVPDEKVLYLPNCAPDSPPGNGTIIRERHEIPLDSPVILLYTRFFEFDQEKLYFLFEEIFRRVPRVRFLVVGKGRSGEEKMLQDAAREWGFDAALYLAGWVEPQEIPHYLAAGDVALYPFADTLINRAKCPAKLVEILRAGTPVVADSVGQVAEYIEPGVSG
ncbi:MAG: glycosyltransferase, partial [Deltaproteobacteria bacterium]|nr:glycosyltransferase [Deltaproteobacteria bacterium]